MDGLQTEHYKLIKMHWGVAHSSIKDNCVICSSPLGAAGFPVSSFVIESRLRVIISVTVFGSLHGVSCEGSWSKGVGRWEGTETGGGVGCSESASNSSAD